MEGHYEVLFGSKPSGKVQVIRQGLYYRFLCRCQLTGEVMCRLWVTCADQKENLGVLVPMGDGFGLDTKLPVKRLGEGPMTFALVPRHEARGATFAPIYPEEPFAYIARLKEGFLARKNGQLGLVLPD